MLSISTKKSKTALVVSLFILSIVVFGCNNSQSGGKKRQLISFKAYNGINYSEVSRRMRNGLSFNEYGYQLEPQWKLKFVSDDSISIFSPTKNAFINFPLTRGYDSIFNAARSWLKVRKITKDSITMEILIQKGDSLDVKGTKVFMRFFADNYVKNVLHTDTSILRRPSHQDTLFIKALSAKANADYTKAFAARQPAKITSRSPLVSVSQRTTRPDILNNFDNSDDYLDPTYDIVIKKAYKDFYFSFTMYIDDKGRTYYGYPLVGLDDEEAKADYIHTSKAIMESYLKLYLNIKPGSTLGIIHSSMVSVHVEGKAGSPKSEVRKSKRF
ncbi:hypothetical protein LX99_01147 [Mucilaginibacter oryzae]|uniref:Lipoprotein n=1 Tax=Mucilaginibacter oryzae TaxID=468058 RepID=A0A316HBW9_9SPHI|nr:hypothetical protein [Mucilaginibacter oryzae]PWK78699.1 hypothetical protein LX99_01147 [Mucilaginibacter oryzae]